MFHGLGDACSNPGMESIDKMLAQGTGATVKCIEVDTIGGGEVIGNFEHIAEEGCKKIAADPTFNGEFNVIGLSQGGLLARYIVEECEMPGKVRNMVTMGGPHMGTDAIPHCFSGFICNGINHIAKQFVYASWAQDWIGPAGYFRDINNYAGYLKGSVFLPKVNNEDSTQRASKYGALRTTRMSSLNSAYLGMFTKDTMIYPKETAWFQSVNENGQVVPLQDSEFWKKDYVGLAALNATGKVTFGSFVGEHLQFTRADITDKIIPALKQ
jgi:palmitoyl-protein thioesterase